MATWLVTRHAIRAGLAVGAGAGLLIAGLPPEGTQAQARDIHSNRETPSLEEVLGSIEPVTPDERREAELSKGRDPDRPKTNGVKPTPVRESNRLRPLPVQPESIRSPRAGEPVVWPESGEAVVKVPAHAHVTDDVREGSTSGVGRAGDLPVWVTTPDDAPKARGERGLTPGTDVAVEVLDRTVARRHGAALAIHLDSADASTGLVQVVVDYTGFEHALGGDFGSRLRASVVEPACLDKSGECAGEHVDHVNDPVEGTVTATMPLRAEGTVMMLSAGEDGPAGDWGATSLSSSSEWSHGGPSGDFSWSYPMRAPEMPGGLLPDLALAYSSGSVDGRTTSTNNQTSWVGEGFTLEPGFIERRYIACADDMGSGANNSTETGDLCWKSDNATMSLGGSATQLVKDSSTGAWRPKDDDGTRVERLTGAGNGARNGEYWRVTTTDGVQYYFGRHKRYSGDTATTNSVLTVPVAGNHSGEPCRSSQFKDSFCDQAYRWLLDYVVDTNDNSMTYFYTQESNRYGQNLNEKSASYHRGAYLRRIEYGQRRGSEHTTPAPARVVFTVAERCLPGGGVNCDPSELNEDTADKWPDVPYDRICSSSSSCSERLGPTFFSRKRLVRVETQVRVSGSYEAVDRWDLTHDFPDPGDGNSAALWLEKVTHSGRAGSAVTLPSVKFYGEQTPNRVDEIDGAPPLMKYRVRAIETETGAAISINYAPIACEPGTPMPTPHTNTKRCFPVYWNFEGSGSPDPRVHWFHKYVVESVVEVDRTGNSAGLESHYTYHGSPGWAYVDDEMIKSEYRTWGEWRGYGRVTTRVGHPDTEQLRTERLYLRGLHGDRAAPSGGTKTVSVTDSWGDSVTDHAHLAGFLREEIVYDGSSKVTSTVHDAWRSAVTASGGGKQARMVGVAATREHTRLADEGWRTTDVRYSYDSHGLLVETDDRGDVATADDDLCTRVEYAKNTSAWIVDAVQRSETVSVRCSSTPSRPADVVSDQRSYYDNKAYGVAPTEGNVTCIEELDALDGEPTYVVTSRISHDSHGRVTSVWDALDRETRTSYTPAVGGPVTEIKTTNPAGHVTTSTLDSRLGVPTRVMDANSRYVDAEYDALGRLLKVWLTDRNKATDTPSLEYSYRVSATQPAAVTTKSLLPSGAQTASVELFDSLLRPRQTQKPAAGDAGGRIVTDNEYDSRGLAVEIKGPYYTTGEPSTTLVNPSTTVPLRTVNDYDGAGRTVEEQAWSHQTHLWSTLTSHGGDRVMVTPPDGGTATTTIRDARGRTTEVRQHHGPTPSGAYDALSYTHTPTGELATITDPAGNTWSFTYDQRNRRVQTHDPDAGTSTTAYDAASQVIASTDGRGQSVHYSYDVLGRKTESRADSPTGELLASWVFDTLEKGYPTSSTSWVDNQAYTTTVYGYDDAYRSMGETVSIPASEGALAGEYVQYRLYNPDGSLQLQWLTGGSGLPSEAVWHYYDAAGYAEWLYGDRTYVADTSYSPFGEVEQYSLGVNLGRASWQTFFYEEGTRRLARVRVDREGYGLTDVDRRYAYDDVGNPLRIADTGSSGPADVQCFSYDHLRRLTEAWAQAGTPCAVTPSDAAVGGVAAYWQLYTYDVTGNRTSLIEHGLGGAPDTVTTYTHPGAGQPRPHAVTTISTQTGSGSLSTTSFAYDSAGNTTRVADLDGTTNYGWDAEGRLASVSGPDGDAAAIYAANGSRLIRRTPDTTTLYVGADEYTLDHATGSVTGQRYYTLGGATLVMRDSSGTITSLAADHQATPLAAIDDQNGIIRRWVDPFGNPRGTTPPVWPGERGFHTGTTDTWAGLIHMGARPYHPGLGRFLAVDPLLNPADSQQINGYAYANNNPIGLTDPDGLEPRPWHDKNWGSKKKGFNYDTYWEAERRGYKCVNYGDVGGCGKSGIGQISKPTTAEWVKAQAVTNPAVAMKKPWYFADTAQPVDTWVDLSLLERRWVPVGRFLGKAPGWVGLILMLCGDSVDAAGCDDAESRDNAANAGSKLLSPSSLADEVANATGGVLKTNKGGFTVEIPNGSRGIRVRVMERGGGRTNYYRVSVPGKATYTVRGEASTDAALTHMDIRESSLNDILSIIARIRGGG